MMARPCPHLQLAQAATSQAEAGVGGATSTSEPYAGSGAPGMAAIYFYLTNPML